MDRKWENGLLVKEIIPRVVTRNEWGALESERKTKRVKLPVSEVVFSNTNSRPCYTREHCTHDLQNYQRTLIEKESKDIPFNFLIGKDGNVYEGMGWKGKPENYETGVKGNKFYNGENISIAFINDQDLKPSVIQIKRSMGLIIYGIQKNYITKKLKILRKCDCKQLFSISDFKNTMMELLGLEVSEESAEESDSNSTDELLKDPRRIEPPFNYSSGEDSDGAKYDKLSHTIRDDSPEFF